MRRLFESRQSRFQLFGLLALCCVFLTSTVAFMPVHAVAQEEGAAEDPDLAPPAKEPPPKAEPGGASKKSDGDAAAQKSESLLAFYFNALGWRYTIAFLVISFSFVALIVMNALTLRRDSIVPLHLVEQFEALLNDKKYQDAYELAKNDDSFLGHVLSAGLAKLQTGYPQAVEAMQEVGEEESMKLEHRLSYIALVGTISPMVGLLGTVDGMVASFRVIATSNTQPKPSELADGISMALITTLVGLVLAIPAIGIFGFFKNRMARLVLEVGILSESLMSRFQNVGTKKN